MNAQVAELRPLGDATVQLDVASATDDATHGPIISARRPVTARELRMQLGMQLLCNTVPEPRRGDGIEVAIVAASNAEVASDRSVGESAIDSPIPADDRRRCEQCANLDLHRGRDGFRRCAAARRGKLPYVASRDYAPVPSVRKRCEGFRPVLSDTDQRPGWERWPARSLS